MKIDKFLLDFIIAMACYMSMVNYDHRLTASLFINFIFKNIKT